MLKPLTYTYKGRPIAPYGAKRRKYLSPGRRKNTLRLFFLTGLGVIFLLIITLLIIWCARSCGQTEESENTQPVPEGAASHASPVSAPSSKPVKRIVEPSANVNVPVKPAVPQTEVSSDINKRAMQVYSAAASAMQKKNYENASKALRLFFEGLQIPPNHPLYDKACRMLSEASMAVYNSGSNPADWTEYTVVPGDNLSRLAKKFDIDIQTITETNHMSGSGLRAGQKLKIPQISWRLRLDWKNRRILLNNNGRLFKIYKLTSDRHADEVIAGIYRIRKHRNPDRMLLVSGHKNEEGISVVLLYSPDNTDGLTENASFTLPVKDWREIFKLIPDKATAEIIK